MVLDEFDKVAMAFQSMVVHSVLLVGRGVPMLFCCQF